MDIDELADTFEMLGEWEERYRFLIEMGRKLPPLPAEEHDDLHKVRGCMSQVWLVPRVNPGPPLTLEFRGDSDAHIVKGLVALLFKLYSGRTPEEIARLDLESVFERLGLASHITMNRRNGFYAMIERIRALAAGHVRAAAAG